MPRKQFSPELLSDDQQEYFIKQLNLSTVDEAVDFWLNQGHQSLYRDLQEEVKEGHYDITSKRWRALVYIRALELLQVHDEIAPATKTRLFQEFEGQGLFGDAGFASAEEAFASISSFKSGGQASDLRFIASTLIPYCKYVKAFSSDKKCEEWFYSHHPRIRITGVPTALRDAIANLEEPERRQIVTNILAAISEQDPNGDYKMKRKEIEAYVGNVRSNKPEIYIYKNGDGNWHVREFSLTNEQLERFTECNRFTAVVIIE